eukprot:491044_1
MTTRDLVSHNPAHFCVIITNVLWHDVYVYCLIGMVLVTTMDILIIDFLPSQHDVSSTEMVIIIIGLVLKWGCIIILCKMLFKYIFLADLKPILCLYVSKIIAFADVYLLAYRLNPSSFSLPNQNSNLTMTFINYSVSCQTLTGISSVSPQSSLGEFLTAIQVLVLGISYDIFILSIAVLRFCEPDEERSPSQLPITKCPLPTNTPLPRRLSRTPYEDTYGTLNDKITNTPRKFRRGTFTDMFIYTPLKSGKSTSYKFPQTRKAKKRQLRVKVNTRVNKPPEITRSASILDEDKTESEFQFPAAVIASCPAIVTEYPGFSSDSNLPHIPEGNKYSSFLKVLPTYDDSLGSSRSTVSNTIFEDACYPKSAPDLSQEPKSEDEVLELTKTPGSQVISNPSGTDSMSNSLSLSFFPNLEELQSHRVIDKETKHQIYERNRWMGRGSVKLIYKHMTLLLFGTEIPRLVAMYLSCKDLTCGSHNVYLLIGIAVDTTLMLLCLFGVLMKISLIHTLPHDVKVNITIVSLIRVYLTLLVLFGILQFDIWVVTKDWTHPAFGVNVATVDIHRFWLMLWHFMFFSVATFTNAGVGANIWELSELGQSINNLEMLLALVFSVVVFGVGLLRLGEEREKAMENFVDKEILQIQNTKSETKNAISYLSIDASAPAIATLHEMVRQKSTVLRKQGLLPGTVTPMVTLAKQLSTYEQTERYDSCYHSLTKLYAWAK